MTKPVFLPSLAFFVGEPGEQIYKQFKDIMLSTNLTEPLQKCVGLIRYTVGRDIASGQAGQPPSASSTKEDVPYMVASYEVASNIFVYEQQYKRSASVTIAAPLSGTTILMHPMLYTQSEEGQQVYFRDLAPLKEDIHYMQQTVMENLQRSRDASQFQYDNISEVSMRVYIIGSKGNDLIQDILLSLPMEMGESNIYLLLCSHSNDPEPSLPIRASANTVEIKDNLKMFSFLFEDISMRHTTEQVSAEAQYVMAQALYALISSEMTLQGRFKESLWPPSSQQYASAGYLITSGITFPDGLLADYCRAYLGAALMHQWGDAIGKDHTSAISQAVQKTKEASDCWLRDKPLKNLFALLASEDIEGKDKSYQDSAEPMMDADYLSGPEKVKKQYDEWANNIAKRWVEGLKTEICRLITKDVEDILLGDTQSSDADHAKELAALPPKGWVEVMFSHKLLLRAYVHECKGKLDELLCHWYRQRQEEYESSGNYLDTLLHTSRKGDAQQQPLFDSQTPLDVRNAMELFRQYIATEQTRRKLSPLTLVAASLLVCVPIILMLFTLFPSWSLLAVVGATGGLVILGSLGF